MIPALVDIIKTVWPRRRPSTPRLAALLRMLGAALDQDELRRVDDRALAAALDRRRQRPGRGGARPDQARDAKIKKLFATGRPDTSMSTLAKNLGMSRPGLRRALIRLGIAPANTKPAA